MSCSGTRRRTCGPIVPWLAGMAAPIASRSPTEPCRCWSSDDQEHAQRALGTLIDPRIFGGTPFGPTNVAQNQPSYDPSAYWRGAAWPNMSYLLWLAARRWDSTEIADQIARNTIAGAEASGWAEYWNPHTGEGLGRPPVMDRSRGHHGPEPELGPQRWPTACWVSPIAAPCSMATSSPSVCPGPLSQPDRPTAAGRRGALNQL